MGKKRGCRPCLCFFHLHAGERCRSRCVVSIQALWWWIPSTARRGPWGYQVTPFWWICRGYPSWGYSNGESFLIVTYLPASEGPTNKRVGRKGAHNKISRFLRVPCFTSRYTHVQVCINKNQKSKIRYSGATNTIPRTQKNIIQHLGSIPTIHPPTKRKKERKNVLGELWCLTLGFKNSSFFWPWQMSPNSLLQPQVPRICRPWSFYPKRDRMFVPQLTISVIFSICYLQYTSLNWNGKIMLDFVISYW